MKLLGNTLYHAVAGKIDVPIKLTAVAVHFLFTLNYLIMSASRCKRKTFNRYVVLEIPAIISLCFLSNKILR